MTVDRERVIAALRAKQSDIEERFGLRLVGLVGSVARGEGNVESDIDVMVDIIRTPTLFQIAHAEEELKGAVGAGLPVEFVFREDLRPALRARIERDVIPI
jgi:predicted nucleotidyltransferase